LQRAPTYCIINLMTFSHSEKHRRSIRLSNFDYSVEGAYFLTICAHNKRSFFGEISDCKMYVNEYGKIVLDEWQKTSILRPRIITDAFVVMPNHIHGIIFIKNQKQTNNFGARKKPPVVEKFGRPTSDSIPTIVRLYKSSVTMKINNLRHSPCEPVWQKNYFEHVIRDKKSLYLIREYIEQNPSNWESDDENPKVGARCNVPLL